MSDDRSRRLASESGDLQAFPWQVYARLSVETNGDNRKIYLTLVSNTSDEGVPLGIL